MKYGIAIFPNREVQQIANSFRKRYDPHYPLIPPHITLKDAFKISDPNILENMIKQIEETTKNMQPFTLNVSHVSSFYPTTNTIYFAIEEHPELTKLYGALNEDVDTTERPFSFVPHVTVAQKLSTDETQDIYKQIKSTELNIETYVDRIHLLYQIDDGTWTVYQTFVLSK